VSSNAPAVKGKIRRRVPDIMNTVRCLEKLGPSIAEARESGLFAILRTNTPESIFCGLWQDAGKFSPGSIVMALTPSNMLPLGTAAPDFRLAGTDGNVYSLQNFSASKLLLVAFICNHCPFVKHVRGELVQIGNDYRDKGVSIIGINSNDTIAYPADNMDNMRKEARDNGYPFPYVLDETQAVAKAYDAACTPDFFVFDANRALIYRGQLDGSRPGNNVPVTGGDLRAALDAALADRTVTAEQKPSVGCNIKWKPGNAPA
jgi:peroxiredoxin